MFKPVSLGLRSNDRAQNGQSTSYLMRLLLVALPNHTLHVVVPKWGKEKSSFMARQLRSLYGNCMGGLHVLPESTSRMIIPTQHLKHMLTDGLFYQNMLARHMCMLCRCIWWQNLHWAKCTKLILVVKSMSSFSLPPYRIFHTNLIVRLVLSSTQAQVHIWLVMT